MTVADAIADCEFQIALCAEENIAVQCDAILEQLYQLPMEKGILLNDQYCWEDIELLKIQVDNYKKEKAVNLPFRNAVKEIERMRK